jgi:uncharacterized membrane protein (UPF0127 family)
MKKKCFKIALMKKLVLILTILTCPLNFADTVKINETKIKTEKAITPKQQAQGLMFKKSLCQNCGMLFIFPQQKISMWMKNTYIPLDMIFADEKGKILCIEKNTTPLSEEQISCPSIKTKYVLEVNAGFADKNNINIGDIIKL